MNSTAVVLMIITVLTYGIVCIGKRMELMDAVTVSFAVLLAGFGMSGGILAIFGRFSLNKTLAVLWLLSVVAAVICRIAGGKPNVCLKQTESIVRPFLRTLILLCLASLVYVVTTHFQPEDDVMINAGKGFAQYLWLVSSIVLVLVCVADILIHCMGYIKAEKTAQKILPELFVAGMVITAAGIVIEAGVHSGIAGILTAVLLLVAAGAAGVGLSMLYQQRDFAELVLLGVSETVLAYLLSAGILIGLNIFSLERAAALTLGFTVAVAGAAYAYKKTKPSCTFQWKKNLIGIGFLLAVIPLVGTTFGMFGMGQDEGVYQAKAIGYVYGYNNNFMTFDEYGDCVSASDKSDYMAAIGNHLEGYNFTLDEEQVQGVAQNDTTGSLHGVHTFSALLAVYARVCGVEHMMQLGTWILALSVFLLWLVLENLEIKTLYKAIALFLYVLSPQVLWQAKTSLVETTLAFVILAMLYLLTDKKHEEYRGLFCIPVVVFAFLHITIYVFMPLFVLMAYGLYFKTGRKSYIAGAVVMLAGYLAGFFMMHASSLTYVYGNYDRLYIGPVGPSNLKAFVTAVSVAGIVFSLVLGLLPVKKNIKAVSVNAQSMRKEQNRFKNTCWRIFVWVFAAAGLAACLLVMKKSAYPSAYMTSYAYLLSSGIILMPVIFIAAFLRPSWFKKKDSIVLLTAMFYYCVIIYSAVFKKEILYYYYYGRYIVPYIAVIVVLGAYILSRTAESMAHIRILRDGYGMLCAAAAFAVAAVLIPYAGIVVNGQDQTQLQWKILTELAETVDEKDSVVVLGEEVVPQLMVSLKYMTDCPVYPLKEDKEAAAVQCARLKDRYSHVYVISGEPEYGAVADSGMDTVYHKDNKIQMDVKMPEELGGIAAWIPYAQEFVTDIQPVAVYEYVSE